MSAESPEPTVFARRYEVLRHLGSGGFGEVYLVRDRMHGNEVALKTLRPPALDSLAPRELFEKRALSEIHVLRRLRHAGIPAIYNDGRIEGGDIFFTMEYVEGITLAAAQAALGRSGERMAPARITRILHQILSVLEHAHNLGIVHRDLKPANIMLERAGTPNERVRVLDFGLAKILTLEDSNPNSLPDIGTLHYMAPEQLGARDVDGRTDLYALAVILYQLCSGRLPITGASDIALLHAKVTSDPTPLGPEEAPEWLRALLWDLLRREMRDRPSLESVLDRLAAAGETTAQEPIPWDEPYRGLLAYRAQDERVFFGREQETAEALQRLEERGALVILGASGAGKSSWLHAGLIPERQRRAKQSHEELTTVFLTPGNAPLSALRAALEALPQQDAIDAVRWASVVSELLPLDAAGVNESALVHLLSGRTTGTEARRSVLLVVDQLEEVATLCADPVERRAFLGLLARVGLAARGRSWNLLLGVRADMLGELLEHPGFRELTNQSSHAIATIRGDALQRVITGPFRGRRNELEAGLAEQIVGDLGDEPGSLPLLSHVLRTLWNDRAHYAGRLTKAGYAATGGVNGALQLQADEALAESSTPADVEVLLLALAHPGPSGVVNRRRLASSAAAAMLERDEASLRALVRPFVARRLITLTERTEAGLDGSQGGRAAVLEVAHERLFSAWPRFRALATREREALDLRRDIEAATAAWNASGRKAELWGAGTSKLRRAEELVDEGRLVLPHDERAFLGASRAAAVRFQRAKNLALGTMAALLVVSLAASWMARRSAVFANTKAEQVMKLSAIQEYEDLVREANDLWPPYASRVASYENWLSRAEELVAPLPAYRRARDELRARNQAPDGDSVMPGAQRTAQANASGDSRWWESQLTKLIDALESLLEPRTGLLGADPDAVSSEFGWSIPRRLEFARGTLERSTEGPDAVKRWDEAARSIAASPLYGGLRLRPQAGLLPIGADPRSGLWEFTHLQSGAPPVRATTGELEVRGDTGIVLVLLPGGTFWMGSQGDDPAGTNFVDGAPPLEGPPRQVTLPAFFLSKFEVTRGQWSRATGSDPVVYRTTPASDPRVHPVESVSWIQCQITLERLGLVLPSEAQWEYGARAGTTTPWWCGGAVESLEGNVNLADQSAKDADFHFVGAEEFVPWRDGCPSNCAAGRFPANHFGLHEVIGNVAEWCVDSYSLVDAEDGGNANAPQQAAEFRIKRGGGANSLPSFARSAIRAFDAPVGADGHTGVRPARRVDP